MRSGGFQPRSRPKALAELAILLILLVAGCSESSSSKPVTAATAVIRVDGSSVVTPISEAAAQIYQRQQGAAPVSVGTSDTAAGFAALCSGESQLNDADRPALPAEVEACIKSGNPIEQITVANDAIVVVVNRENSWVKCLTTEQLGRIWTPNSGVTNWRQLDPRYPNIPIGLYGPEPTSSMANQFSEVITGSKTKEIATGETSPLDRATALKVGDIEAPGALGYTSIGTYQDDLNRLNEVAVDFGQGCVKPRDGKGSIAKYQPLLRPVFIYPSIKALSGSEVFGGFLQSYLRRLPAAIATAGLIELTDKQAAASKNEYQQALRRAGTSSS